MAAAVIVLLLLLGLIPAFIARHKGQGFFTYWLFGILLFVVALPVALTRRDLRRRCEYCDELVRPDAVVCRHCGRDLHVATA